MYHRKIAFITYETEFAPCGGIAAVLSRLPAEIQSQSATETIVMSPFHHRIGKMEKIRSKLEKVMESQISLLDRTLPFEVFMLDGVVRVYFIRPLSDEFFGGVRHPYDVLSDILRRDSLVFGSMTVEFISRQPWSGGWAFFLQDWESAPAVLAGMGRLTRNNHWFLTLHNSYDQALTDENLWECGIDPWLCPGTTVLDRTLPLVDETVFTVSGQFAIDLAEDPLQTRVMAPHLAGRLRNRISGIDNGPFVNPSIEPEAMTAMMQFDFKPLEKWKADRRSKFLDALQGFQSSEESPVWGHPALFSGAGWEPWFVMAGRDDPRQKGYDVAAGAVRRYIDTGGAGQFLFFPIPGDEGRRGLSFLHDLATEFPGKVIVLPFIFKEGFMSALQAADFGIMPSIYEPFGMANEFYFNGAVGIGRATGGIIQQIAPLRSSAAFSPAVGWRVERWHSYSSPPTGILFRERDGIGSNADDWRRFNDYDPRFTGRMEIREKNPIFRDMVKELAVAFSDAEHIRMNQPVLYFQMLKNGLDHIRMSFSWVKAARAYIRYLDA